MIIPTVLIIPPAILALILYMWLYYVENPEKRVRDLRFLLAVACVGVMGAEIFIMVKGFEPIASVVLCAVAFGLLIAGAWMVWDGPIRALRYGR